MFLSLCISWYGHIWCQYFGNKMQHLHQQSICTFEFFSRIILIILATFKVIGASDLIDLYEPEEKGSSKNAASTYYHNLAIFFPVGGKPIQIPCHHQSCGNWWSQTFRSILRPFCVCGLWPDQLSRDPQCSALLRSCWQHLPFPWRVVLGGTTVCRYQCGPRLLNKMYVLSTKVHKKIISLVQVFFSFPAETRYTNICAVTSFEGKGKEWGGVKNHLAKKFYFLLP